MWRHPLTNFTTSFDLSWDQFASCHQNTKKAFEDLTRQLFNREYCPDVHLVSVDNNPGVEVEPVKVISKYGKEIFISFQSKHFGNKISYDKIKDSYKKAVEYYKGGLDIIYLYCNRNLNKSTVLDEAEKLMSEAGVKLVKVTNEAILDMLRRPEYSDLALAYFGVLQLSEEWFKEKADAAIEYLDDRYNKLFNIDTKIAKQLSLFLHDDAAVEDLNNRKKTLLDGIQKERDVRFHNNVQNTFLEDLGRCVSSIQDINNESIEDVLSWDGIVKKTIASDIKNIRDELSSISAELQSESGEADEDTEEKNSERRNRSQLLQAKDEIEGLLDYADRLAISSTEQALICNKCLFITGISGSGKSHLLANELHGLINADKAGVLILGQSLMSSDMVEKQILNWLDVDYSFKDFMTVLDNYGIIHNQTIPFMIDAVNESWHKETWKPGLDNIVRSIKATSSVKLIVTYRNEYKNSVISKSVERKIDDGEIVALDHPGFRGVEKEAVKQFLNHYHIPFSPTFYFEYDISNPLFLTLFCRTYKEGKDQSLPDLYERLLEQVNDNVCEHLHLDMERGNENLLSELVNAFCIKATSNGRRFLSRSELVELPVWKNWGLQGEEGKYITEFVREKFFYDIMGTRDSDSDEESYYFAYDHMFDYYCAKYISKEHKDDEEGLIYLICEQVLQIKNGKVFNNEEDVFINICVCSGADKSLHIFEEVLKNVTDSYDRYNLVEALLDSYSWRSDKSIGKNELSYIIKKYSISCESFTRLLINNSMKMGHPFNAEYMHNYLLGLSINERDYDWTISINQMDDEENRLWQLIRVCEKGENFQYENDEQLKLFLILLSWILTSSNRNLRDHTSKALVEILKDHFDLCEWLLRKFESCNDPYVLQRLYTVVLGAVLKRSEADGEVFHRLASYIYETIFDKEYVYPDILLRDSACIIIERYIYEYPSDTCEFNPEVFRPPYNSEDIPAVERKEYKDSEEDEKSKLFGVWNITSSLNFEGMGMYGDFGRYVFQSALDYFDIPDQRKHNGASLFDDQNSFQGNIYYYAIHYIFDELGYTNDRFGEYDSHLSRYSYRSRSEVLKTERIGKKYEWIAMYNILARISDRYKLHEYDQEPVDYEGAWSPDVRDFDPTFNHELNLKPDGTPKFSEYDEELAKTSRDNYADFIKAFEEAQINTNNSAVLKEKQNKAIENWLLKKIQFFKDTVDNLILRDQFGDEWVVLSRYIDKKKFSSGDYRSEYKKFDTWSWTVPFIAKKKEAESIVVSILERRRGSIHGISAYDLGTYSGVYSREYPWSPACKEMRDTQWRDLEYQDYYDDIDPLKDVIRPIELDWNSSELKTATKEEKAPETTDAEDDLQNLETDSSPDVHEFLKLMKQYRGSSDAINYRRPTEVIIGRAMAAVTSFTTGFQYDATSYDNDGSQYSITCLAPDITEKLKLRQGKVDGFFYDENGKLAVIDTDQYEGHAGVVIRKEILEKYLRENDMDLFWVVYGEKQYFTESHMTQKWSEWEGAFLYRDGKSIGRLQGFKGRQE